MDPIARAAVQRRVQATLQHELSKKVKVKQGDDATEIAGSTVSIVNVMVRLEELLAVAEQHPDDDLQGHNLGAQLYFNTLIAIAQWVALQAVGFSDIDPAASRLL